MILQTSLTLLEDTTVPSGQRSQEGFSMSFFRSKPNYNSDPKTPVTFFTIHWKNPNYSNPKFFCV